MTTKKAIEIASRIYGLYLLIQLPMALTGLFTVFSINQDQFVRNPILYQTWAVLNPIVFTLIALVLIMKAELIANLIVGEKSDKSVTTENNAPVHSRLSFWFILLGLYFFIRSISKLVGDIVRHPLYQGDAYSWSILLANGCMLFLSCVLIFKSEWVESTITKRIKR